MKKLKSAVLIFLTACIVISAKAQNNENFIVGDPAPPIKYSKWLKGTPVTSFKKNHLYVIECWATWCGPCIAAMPHLSELSKKYNGKATFIGMNVWEKIPESKSYETVLPNVSKFVESLGDKMSYNVAVDSKDRYFAREWLAKAKAPGIPTTFLVKDGRFIWIGHPSKLEEVIIKVLAGTYDIEEQRKAHLWSVDISNKSLQKKREEMEPIENALKAKQFDEAFALIDTLIAKDAMQKYTLNIRKFNIILENIGEKQAIAFVEDWKKKDGNRVSIYPAQSVAEKTGLSKETYNYAAEAFRSAGTGSNVNPMFHELTARCYGLAGDYTNATLFQQKAIDAAKESVKAGRHVGVIHDYTVTEYEGKLKEYQQKLKSGK